jgi:MoaA/NifB/PqqE/SkfB family radical SAM enzyme
MQEGCEGPEPSEAMLGVTRAEIYVGSACNLACRYCNSRHRREPPWEPGALEGLLDDLAATGTRHIQWTGGEATVHPDLPALVARATAGGMAGSISTNGTADAQVYDALVRAGMGRFYVSLDLVEKRGFDHQTGSSGLLARVRTNIERLCAAPGTHVTVNSILDADTFGRLMAADGAGLQDLLGWCQQAGVDDFKFLPASRARLVTVFEEPGSWERFETLCQSTVPDRYPMFHYRLRSMRAGGHGLRQGQPHPCWLCLDDRAFDSRGAYPCIVRLREGGEPLFHHGDDTPSRAARLQAFLATDRSQDPICRAHCYDLYRELSVATAAKLRAHAEPG